MRMNWADVLAALHGTCGSSVSVPDTVAGVSTDNRKVRPGDVFFCIRGERFDGHEFAVEAVAGGAAAVVADRKLELADAMVPPVPVVMVNDATRALGRLARAWRERTAARVVGVTGTAGKTTVKELLAHVLSTRGATARNAMNLNNQLGLPRSILATGGDEAYWVMEAGISRAGDMDELGEILAPDIALILNAGAGHTEGLGDNVAAHKARLIRYLKPGGLALVNADYPDLVREARACVQNDAPVDAQVELFTASCAGNPGEFAYSASYLGPETGSETHDGVPVIRGRYAVRLGYWEGVMIAPFRGSYGAENVVAVSAAAHALGLEPEAIASSLAHACLPAQRFACSRAGNWLVVDDSYNANPLSTARMIESAADLAVFPPAGIDGTLVCVLGEMLELGDRAEPEHEALGEHVAHSGARLVVWKGNQGQAVRRGLERAAFAGVFVEAADADALPGALEAHGLDGGVILFKGSRGNHLEEFVTRLVSVTENQNAV